MSLRILFAIGLAAIPNLPLFANVKLAPLFRDGAVLQRDKNVPVWGWADPGEKITVQFSGQSKSAEPDATGRWIVSLAPLAANAKPQDLVVTGKNQITVPNVLVGDVWLSSGQSNMFFPVVEALNREKEKAAANNPLIRYFATDNEGTATTQTDTKGEWQTSTPETVGNFSAVAYFFARDLQPRIGVPVGIIKATLGGSPIESWLSPEGLNGFTIAPELQRDGQREVADYPGKKAAYDEALAKWSQARDAAKAAGQPFRQPPPIAPRIRNLASSLFNSNIAPLLPYALRGILWYQGESNSPHYGDYGALFATMIKQWRRDFRQYDLPFLYVQLANYALKKEDPTGQQWAFQREAQASALSLPNTGMALAIDVGDANNLHPPNKQEVGRRLSLLARQIAYGEKINGRSPQPIKFAPVKGAIEVTLSPAHNIQLRGEKATDLEIAGADKKFVSADVKITGDKLTVSSPLIPQPKFVRYLWSNAPTACLFDGDGLPVAPFRSDEKPIRLFPSPPAPAQPAAVWNMKELMAPPTVYSAIGTNGLSESEGIRPIFYDGVALNGKPTRVFAWLGIPKSSGGKLPGIVLVHGGGGTAYRYWVKLWMDRGYVAIAMDTGGMMPQAMAKDGVEQRVRDPFGGPGGEGFSQSFNQVDQQWPYHAVAAIVRADSLLRSLPEVDPERIGLTGVSWGGLLTELAAGVDSRFKFAAPVYGSGFLGENSFWLENDFQQIAPNLAERWLALWDPSQYVGRTKMPVLFCNGTNDKHFRPDCWQKTYRGVRGPMTLSMKLRMPHGHPPLGDPKEITVFADSLLRGQPPLARITGRAINNGVASIRWDAVVPVKQVEVLYTTDHGKDWLSREWKTMPAEMDSKTSARAKIPAGSTALFFNTIDERSCVVSSEHWDVASP